METSEEAKAASAGCISCHTKTDEASMHPSGTVTLGCATCHGGDPKVSVAAGLAMDSAEYKATTKKAHPQPRVSDLWKSAANPERAYTNGWRNRRSTSSSSTPAICASSTRPAASCHAAEVRNVRTSMMTHGAMLWGRRSTTTAAPPTRTRASARATRPTARRSGCRRSPRRPRRKRKPRAWLPYLEPLPRWEVSQPGNVLRVFERGGGKKAEIGNPTRNEEPGRPDVKLSDRGFGTELRTDPVFLGLQKTRLLDPLLSFPGTNDQPGDYRTSGCTACHVVYANDRSPVHAGTVRAVRQRRTHRRRSIRRSIRSGSSPAIRSSTPSPARSRPASA